MYDMPAGCTCTCIRTCNPDHTSSLVQGDHVGQVTAFDQDVGVNDGVIYSITSGNSPINGSESFAINSTTGVIYVNTTRLDRETHASYILTIGVCEGVRV